MDLILKEGQMDLEEPQILEVGDLIGKEVIRTIDEQMFVLSSIQRKESTKKLFAILYRKEGKHLDMNPIHIEWKNFFEYYAVVK